MNATRVTLRERERGQTLVIALFIMGTLLLLSFAYVGIINRNIQQAGRQQTRSVAGDVAEAGIRYAHGQLMHSDLGADWRGNPVALQPTPGDPNRSSDPDAFYLRPPNRQGFSVPGINPQLPDQGGPDGLGPFFRVDFADGRALVRVRYAPSDANVFANDPAGPLRNPGAARNYLIIESVGRRGRVNLLDPTTAAGGAGFQFQNFADQNQFSEAFHAMQRFDRQHPTTRRLIAFASIGTIESARFITNKHRVSRPAEIGVPSQLGASYVAQVGGPAEQVRVPTLMGTRDEPVGTLGNHALVGGFGSIYSNADLMVHGTVQTVLNRTLGDGIHVNGSIMPADANARLVFDEWVSGGGGWTATNQVVLAANLNSRNPNFNTFGGLLRDGVVASDAAGFPRGVIRKEPPSVLAVDPETGQNRYLRMTRESGIDFGGQGGNSGRFGHGRGVYVDNFADRQIRLGERGRQDLGTAESLVADWLNPNNTRAGAAWQGPFYVPPGAFVQLAADGFTIVRDARGPVAERTWKFPGGVETNEPVNRFRIGRGTDRQMRIVNAFTPNVNIHANLQATDYDRGQPFNGVLYFEGNVRVRGVVPTDVQLTLVSNATIYVEGSITKGVEGNHWTATYNLGLGDPEAPTGIGQRKNRMSSSMLFLAAREYVAVNTTMFMGPAAMQALTPKQDVPAGTGYVPVRVEAAGGQLELLTEFALNSRHPSLTLAQRLNPSTWPSFAGNYQELGTNDPLLMNLMMTHSLDEGPNPATFIALDVNQGVPTSTYFFPNIQENAASAFYPAAFPPPNTSTHIQMYGLGVENWQRYARFEAAAFPFMPQPGPTNPNNYVVFDTATNHFSIRTTSVGGVPINDYLLARAQMMPNDVRIEAVIFAEEGSFFVIPGPWFNGNPNDTRDRWHQSYTANGSNAQAKAVADRERLENFGTAPEVPFFGEPVDVRVTVLGAVAENMPPPISQQAEWIRRWGWIPGSTGATLRNLPSAHVPAGFENAPYVPNLVITFDPVLASGRAAGFIERADDPASSLRYPPIRTDGFGRTLPPIPRLPVSPTLAYFGEVR
jgi:hypothetical protein